ncbi:phytoene/squalene synthase family protein [Vicingaceae bacterium]|nr:phytoene/squalene synthase family protein [Vicingaceae bacterium]MDB4061297.1 phytoene/squalene synthase family protein [Vicingaceae bacterium]MDB4083155.1 phytoene/squalene synthase family protein [Vicingaceae bacterium]MDC1451911.1 phytoene/squalene synthase family protein [Vicingaceae bacterium]
MEALYQKASLLSSKVVTNCYSTSFSMGINALGKEIHDPIYAIYGFVRLADEIVDTFHQQDKKTLLDEFVNETHLAIERKLSLNPVLHSFQWAVNKYNIERPLIDAFIKSMEWDLTKTDYTRAEYEEYIYGSAEVVGLMCLRVFCKGDESEYQKLKFPAERLGAAFQKINFLRDLKDDFDDKGRTYFPNVTIESFNDEQKREIEADILKDFQDGFKGIKDLPKNSKFGVYTAYCYYLALFDKIKGIKADRIRNERIRITDVKKYAILAQCLLKDRLGIL